jgi:hypothetical protein
VGSAVLVLRTVFSALSTLVLPRSSRDWIARLVLKLGLGLFRMSIAPLPSYAQKDRVMALYAPTSLLLLLFSWLALILAGYVGMYWAAGIDDLNTAFRLSGSSLLTLGFENTPNLLTTVLSFTEALLGLMLITLLIAYLPTMYAAFSKREAMVSELESLAGAPPSGPTLLRHYYTFYETDDLNSQWAAWRKWFSDIAETHTSLSTLVFFRSPQPHNSWINSAGAVLDAASLTLASGEEPENPFARQSLESGCMALVRIAAGLDLPLRTAAASLSREEFMPALEMLVEAGMPVSKTPEQVWEAFNELRKDHLPALEALRKITHAPEAAWLPGKTSQI